MKPALIIQVPPPQFKKPNPINDVSVGMRKCRLDSLPADHSGLKIFILGCASGAIAGFLIAFLLIRLPFVLNFNH